MHSAASFKGDKNIMNKLDWMMMSPLFHGFVLGLPFILRKTDILTDINLYFLNKTIITVLDIMF